MMMWNSADLSEVDRFSDLKWRRCTRFQASGHYWDYQIRSYTQTNHDKIQRKRSYAVERSMQVKNTCS